jgi:predicted 2-oxoglutarate/Fe(II)-dependent dioxygenase YbiX/peroxiredoxin
MQDGPKPLTPGDPVPLFKAPAATNPRFEFGSVAGRWIVVLALGQARQPASQAALAVLAARRELFDDDRATCFVVTMDRTDLAEGRVADSIPGIRVFDDFGGTASQAFGTLLANEGERVTYAPLALLIDPGLRVHGALPLEQTGRLLDHLAALPAPDAHAGIALHAPVMILPRVFETSLCDALIAAFHASGGEASGFMREKDGRTVLVQDAGFKQRRDHLLADDAPLRGATRERILRRVVPEIAKAFQFKATRMERYLVARYGANEGHFRPHRDNTTQGTAHRRFAVSINLNDGFDGGGLRFPEFGGHPYKAPPGAAVVFGCGLLHEVMPVTAGERFAFLPFLYDDAAAAIRAENAKFLDMREAG